MKSIEELEGIHSGKNIFVIASGKTADYIDPWILDKEISIGVNQVYKRFDVDYVVKKDGVSDEEKALKETVIVSKHKYGGLGHSLNDGDYFFEHNKNAESQIVFDGLHPNGDKIVVSFSTITSAIHLAAFMGAKDIFLIGHDCATLDGFSSFDGYHNGVPPLWNNIDGYNAWLGGISAQTVAIREYVKQEYGCGVYSINPFIGLKMEGHIVK